MIDNSASLTGATFQGDFDFTPDHKTILQDYEAPHETVTAVLNDPVLYPSVYKYKTETQIKHRLKEVAQMFKDNSTSERKKMILRNEYWMLTGKGLSLVEGTSIC